MSDSPLIEARRLPESHRLRLVWADGFQAEVEYDRLRGFCPCASCQGHGAGEIRFHAPAGPITIEHIEPVGNYAISFRFSDGHATGIYRFDFLRRISSQEP
jgi:DUF971 family protein